MISGRCNLSSTIRYASKLSNKRHYYLDRDRSLYLVSGDLPLVAHHPSRYSPVAFLQSARMASTSSNSSKGESSLPGKPLNRLALEKSPYLLQHATNPVHWYPWSDEAFEKAREEEKIIFLSVGYSTCHWCHVMEKESFENESIAEVMNKHFINIKVDREERPDIDRIYMTFVQTITGHGGWPMSVFLTPDLAPITGGTYFPPTERYGQPGFKTILQEIAKKWDSNKAEIRSSGGKIIETLKRATHYENENQELPSEECGRMCAQQLSKGYEIHYGGFSDAPKFPQPVNLNFLLHMYARDPNGQLNQQCLTMCTYTLAKMANGGIHDHIGQGFARYSVDGEWHVPHFEKMLYDQGQLLQSYADAFIVTKEPFFAEVVDDIAKYVIRDLRHKEGGFYSAEDADSFPKPDSKKKEEGAFYVWTQDEISSLLDKPIPDSTKTLSDVFCFHYNVRPSGNVKRYQDPHGELTGKNVLIVSEGLENTAQNFGISLETTKNYLKEACQVLFEERLKRPRPHLDDKIVTAWNGLMMTGLARAGVATGNKQYIDYATNTAEFIERHLFDKTNNVLLRSCYRNSDDVVIQASVPINGFHVDYAFVVKGLLDLYEANFDERWLEFAERLQDIQDNLFWDAKGGGYFATTTGDSSVILRLKDDQDGAEPSSNSVACGNLLRLAAYLNRNEFRERAGQLLQSFREYLMRVPAAFPELVSACLRYHDTTTQIYIAGKHNDNDTDELIRVVHNRLIPGKIFVLADYDQQDNYIFRKNEIFSKMKPLKGRPTAFVCRHHTCSLPVTSAEHLAALLDEKD